MKLSVQPTLWKIIGCVLLGWSVAGLPWANATTQQSPPAHCQKVCQRVTSKHATRRCQHRWKCGLQKECQWVNRMQTDATGEQRLFRVQQCGYVRRCHFEEQCRYQHWKLKCELRCVSDTALVPLRRIDPQGRAVPVVLSTLADCRLQEQEKTMFAYINQERVAQKLPLLQCSPVLAKESKRWSQLQCFRGELSHDRLAERLKESGVNTSVYAENVAAGPAVVSQIFQQWMKSPKHRNHILHRQFTHVGVGLYLCGVSEHTHYWTQIFAQLSIK